MSERLTIKQTSRFYRYTVHLEITPESPYHEEAKNWSPAAALDPPPDNLKFNVCQLEIGKQTNKSHYQGFLITHNAIRLAQVKTYLKAQWANVEMKNADAVEDMIAYCTKEDTRAEGAEPFIIGKMPEKQQGKRNDLLKVHENIQQGMSLFQIANANPTSILRYTNNIRTVHSMFMAQRAQTCIRNVQVIVLIGPPGVGKTEFVYRKNGMANCYSLSTKSGQTVWWDNYEGQKCIILDDFYGTGLHWQEFLRLLDKYPLQLQVKGSTTWAQFTKVYITSNRDWFQWYPGQIKGSQWKSQIGALYRRFSKILTFKSRDSSGRMDILEEQIVLENQQPILPAYVTEAKNNMTEDGVWPEDFKPNFRYIGCQPYVQEADYDNWDGSATTNENVEVPNHPLRRTDHADDSLQEITDSQISDAESLRSEERSEDESESDDSFIVSEDGDNEEEEEEDVIIINNKRRRL